MSGPFDAHARIIHPTYVRLLLLYVRRLGVPIAEVLAGTGLGWRQLLAEKHFIGFDRLRAVVLAARQRTGRPALGLEWGLSVETAAHGLTGAAIATSRDVLEALRAATIYRALRGRAVRFDLETYADGASLVIREPFDFGDMRSFILEAHAGIIEHFLASVAGAPLTGIEYRFPYAPPAWQAAYARSLAGTIRFRAARMEVRVPNKSLAVPGVMADAGGRATIIASAERQLALQRGGEWVGRVRQRLLERRDAYPTLAAVARDLNVSSRTLLRRLKDEGATYQALLDEARKEAAAWFLAETREPVATIATRLGYADASNFSRSFRRWFGTPPAAFRRRGAARR